MYDVNYLIRLLIVLRNQTMNYLTMPFILVTTLLLLCIFGNAGADMVIGGETEYVVQKGDCLIIIGARLGLNWQRIVRDNNFDTSRPLKIGSTFKVNTRRIVPKTTADGIIINIPEGMLYFFERGTPTAIPVGLGQSDNKWRTPLGKFSITAKEKDPTWHVPKSIQEEMEEKGEEVKTIVEPGPDNPLGRYAIKTSLADIMIHETIWPTSVHQYRSHGCIRVLPEYMEKLYPDVKIGTYGELIYEPIKIALTGEGRVYIEVHRDIYKMLSSVNEEVKTRIEKRGVSDKVNWQKINSIVNEKSGIAEDITL
jgi:L,D-transpeptidase ErfK/SrfK